MAVNAPGLVTGVPDGEREREGIRNSQCVMQGIGRGYKKRLSVVICDG